MEKDAVFRFDGGATWLNLLATQGQSFGARPVERLPTPDSGSRWLTRVGYPPRDAVTPANLDQLVLLREALRGLAMAAVAGRDPSPDALAHVRRVASALTDLAFTSPPEHGVAVEAALGMIAIQALVTLQGPDRQATVDLPPAGPSPLQSGAFAAQPFSQGWRIDWMTPGGGVQTTLVYASEGAAQ